MIEMDEQIMSSPNTLVQCRICHDDDADSNMDTPCSCRGTLKYAHQKCVQRWCNEKGDTTCEICQQQLKPGYTAPPPPPLFHYGGSPINLGGNWEISRRDLQNHQFIAMFNANREFLELEFEYSSATSTRSLIFCRIVAIIFIVLLLLRHTLPIIFILSGAGERSLTVCMVTMLVVLRIIGMIVPVYIMVKAIIAIQRFQYQGHQHSLMQGHEDNEIGQSQLRVIHIQ
ncbi:E3 ubiquitin ligase SUD1 [Spatholobus suberectus]|nr:E3 ubiquitin ligase SUD1 [Spatholobus suberectus]